LTQNAKYKIEAEKQLAFACVGRPKEKSFDVDEKK